MDTNGDSRSKRKQPPTPVTERPMKQFKQGLEGTYMDSEGENGHAANGYHGELVNHQMEVDEHSTGAKVPVTADTAEWQATIEQVVKSVVSIHFCQTRSFDTDPAIASEATGFVVDAERGLILTNRHVVGAGPFWGYCIFDNHEDCDVYPVYRDPVHDFGFLRFNPKALKYMQLSSLTLRPDHARVGAEIRVVGNDAGEKLSILSGVISRLDRNAPEYGEGYSDFNTNYIQAAAAASGGSSGSPVVNIDGHAIALQAGGRSDGAATDYFLPLDRPLRALQCIQRGEHIERGTIQTQWMLRPFDECRRLGLSLEREAEIRLKFPKETGMLAAEIVLPEGPAHDKIREGDLLIKVNNELITQFIPLDAILDSHVGGQVKILIERGGKPIEVEIPVEDLHSITPDRYVTVAGASFHDISYQQARLYAIATKDVGVYVCEASGTFKFEGCESGWLIQDIDNKETPNLDTFIEVMKQIPDRARVTVHYKHVRDLHSLHAGILLIDRHWSSKMTLATRNDKSGLWDFTDIADPLPAMPLVPKEGSFATMPNSMFGHLSDIVKSFVKVSVTMPMKIDGYPRSRKSGHGLVIDAEQGLVVVSRAILPFDLCDITINIAESIVVSGKVVFMHPLQNFAVIKYDASLVKAPVRSAKLSTTRVNQGEKTIFFGYNQNFRPVFAKTTITDITTVAIPASPACPRYRAIHLDAITVDTNLATQCGSGVLLSQDGTVQALWLNFLGERSHSGKDVEYHLGMATPTILPVINQIIQGTMPKLRILNVEMQTIQMDQADVMGVPTEWRNAVRDANPERHQLFMIRKVDSGESMGLIEGDIILTLNEKLITRVSDLDVQYDCDTLDAVIVRRGKIVNCKVGTVPTEDVETDRVVVFCGAILQRPHHAVRQQISSLHSQVYISSRLRGSPAYAFCLAATNFIIEVNDVPTPDLDSFLHEALKIPDNEYFRLRVKTFDNITWTATMKKNEHYFPTIELRKDPSNPLGWAKTVHESERGGDKQLLSTAMDTENGAVEVDELTGQAGEAAPADGSAS
ncbi:trypsin-like serine protease [Eremomyces bilateralis CBS 781.70]|uniref:Pro-apoptotic serine protease NMA111 n=1 Tax=Eremomyces bilateralis CBS 781.70 TaxID=1392243 RepID=A0A6G1FUN7_9PEZI|nr:trypsin-like serine protease [Eremomyces bilateralis CBS 781.70]KAF1809402.1 trypsin-like serine protease [Eremomyces bilateralis CBS 781.70]